MLLRCHAIDYVRLSYHILNCALVGVQQVCEVYRQNNTSAGVCTAIDKAIPVLVSAQL